MMHSNPVDPLNLGGAKIWQPFHEPLRVTLLRTVLIGLLVGLVVALLQRRPVSWPQWTGFALWFTSGGHWVELFFLNWLRPRLAAARWRKSAAACSLGSL